MQFDFDQEIDRQGTNALATDGYASYLFGEKDQPELDGELTHLWVADMQFATSPAVVNAMRSRLDHPIFGYTANFDATLPDAFGNWCLEQYGWAIDKTDLVVSLGIIPALYTLVDLVCADNDKVLTLTPAYGFFQKATNLRGRSLVTSPLIKKADRYEIDFDDFARKAADPHVRLFFLCYPHNPTGQAWSIEILADLVRICTANNVLIVSDEVHCDLYRSGRQHIPLASVSPGSTNIVTCMSPSKTFNLAGLMTALIMIPDRALRSAWEDYHYPFTNPLGMAAALGAYTDGAEWLTQLRTYLDRNFEAIDQILSARLPAAQFAVPDATYLAWVDLSAYFGESLGLTRFFLNEAGVVVEGGEMFVANGEGKVRINAAAPKRILEKSVHKLCDAVLQNSRPK